MSPIGALPSQERDSWIIKSLIEFHYLRYFIGLVQSIQFRTSYAEGKSFCPLLTTCTGYPLALITSRAWLVKYPKVVL
jgi:hypothetical protein